MENVVVKAKIHPALKYEEIELKAAIFQHRAEWFLTPGLLKANEDREMSLAARIKRHNILNLLETVRKNLV